MSRVLGLGAPVMTLVLAVLVLSLFLAFVRLVRGPSVPDRVVALDLMSLVTVGILATYTIATDRPVLLDVALALALLAFLATVALAVYTERAARPRGDRPRA